MENGKKVIRNSNVELLRIIAMFMIIGHHYSYYGGFEYDTATISFNRMWYQFLLMGGKIGANIFLVISAWFLTGVENVPYKKLQKLWGQISFYAIVLLSVSFFLNEISGKAIVKALFPISFEQWWYASGYFILLLMVPFLNKWIQSVNREDYRKFVCIATVLWTVIPTFTGQKVQSNMLVWFVYLYLLVAYIKKYNVLNKVSASKCLRVAVGFYVITYLSSIVFDVIGTRVPLFGNKAEHFYDIQSITVLGVAIFSLLYVVKEKEHYVGMINGIAQLTFGIYLIHDNSNVRNFLWNVFGNKSFQSATCFPVISLGVILATFIVCAFIEWLRVKCFEKAYLNIVEKICGKFWMVVKHIVGRIKSDN